MDPKESPSSNITRREFLKRGAKNAIGLGGIALSGGKSEALRRGLENIAGVGVIGRGLEAAVGLAGITMVSCSRSQNHDSDPASSGNPYQGAENGVGNNTETTLESSSKLKPSVETDIRTEIIYDFAPNVPQPDKETLMEAAEGAINFYRKALGVYARGPIFYFVDYNPSDLSTAHVSGRAVRFNTAVWEQREEALRKQIIYHEYFHIMQEATTRKTIDVTNKNRFGDVVMSEGMAEYASYMGIIDAGLMTYQKAKDIQLGWLKNSPKLPHIGSLSYRNRGAYTLGFFVIDFLAGERGMEAVKDYLKNAYNLPWEEAFLKTFGMSKEEGYNKFEREWRTVNKV